MRRKFIAGNWKMNHGPAATSEFFSKFGAELKEAKEVRRDSLLRSRSFA